MAVRSQPCPPDDVLVAFASGRLDETAAEKVLAHLETCHGCHARAAGLSGDNFVRRLRAAHGGGVEPKTVGGVPPTRLTNSPAEPMQPAAVETLSDVPRELRECGEYEIVRELGRGGMGIVYLARHRLSGRMEVLKVMKKALLGQADGQERFLREIQSAARLDHKNVVKMYTALERGELMVLVMEYVPGEDLARVVKERGPLPVLNACCYVQQAAAGLQHAFEKGMIHRDVKPQNLILARDGKKHIVKVLDFGLAKATHGEEVATGLTSRGAMMGTPGYMAPEQSLDAATADIRADVYSLGCTLYHLLAGKPPFTGRSAFEVVQAHHSVEARPLNLVRPEVPEALAAVVGKMMAKDAAQRYQTPAEVVRALKPFVKGALKPLPPQAAPLKEGPQDPAPPVVRETMMEGDGTVARALKPAGAQGSKKWLTVPRAVGLLLAGLIGLAAIIVLLKGNGSPTTAKPPTAIPQGNVALTTAKPGIEPIKPPKQADPGDTRQEPKPGEEREYEIARGVRMKFCWIPPGRAQLGSPKAERAAVLKQLTDKEEPEWLQSEAEEKRGEYRSKGFWLGKYPVTQGEWVAVLGVKNPSRFCKDGSGKDKVPEDTSRFPVEQVSADEDCPKFLAKLNEEAGAELVRVFGKRGKFVLPHEDEWEYACRGGKGNRQAYYFGDELNGKQANCDGTVPFGTTTKGPYLERTTEVGTYARDFPHPWGLCDMHGNVYQWCENSYNKDPKKSRVIRGGSWYGDAGRCRAAYRIGWSPGVRDNGVVGCRVCLRLD